MSQKGIATAAEAPAAQSEPSWLRLAMPHIPLARVAVFRVLIYAFVILDIFVFMADVKAHGHVPEFYNPVLIGRKLPFPEPSVGYAIFLQWAITLSCCVAMTGRAARTSGFAVAIFFLAWVENSQGFSYVQHDHMALIIATWVLPTVGTARFADHSESRAAGWALRMVQIATVATYFGSVISKVVTNGSLWAWPNSSVFTWAFMRRGSDLVSWLLDYPLLLKVSQWGVYFMEILSPVVFLLRNNWRYLAIGVFFAFHLATHFALKIHFLPTVICWFAFSPLEKIPAALRRATSKLRASSARVRS